MATLTELLFEVVDSVNTGATYKIVSNEPQMPIERKMLECEDDPYDLICGTPIEGRLYLVTKFHTGLYADLLFEHVSLDDGSRKRLYGFLIPDES